MTYKKQSRNSRKSWGKILSVLGVLVGVGLLILLVSWTGFSEIANIISKGGPALFLLAMFYPIELISRGYGWKFVYPKLEKPRTGLFFMGIWFAQSINRLLPTATIGGVIVRGRYLMKKGAEETAVITSLIADKTAHAVATVAILVLGLILILTTPVKQEIMIGIIAACLLLSFGIFLFIRLQRSSGLSSLLEKWSDRETGLLSDASSGARDVEQQLDGLYKKPRGFVLSVMIRVMGDIALVAEVWAAAWLMDTPVSLIDALTLRMVAFGIRSAAFVIWGGLGVQESTYALLSAVVGLSPASLVAISLATRVREIVTSIPGVMLWLGGEGYEAFKMKRTETQAE